MIKNVCIAPLIILVVLTLLSACTPNIHPAGSSLSSCHIINNAYITRDGTELPLTTWQPQHTGIKAIIIALHGFNDYSWFFQQPGQYFSQQGIVSYAYDQRGFGRNSDRGLWAGVTTYIDDLNCLIDQAHQKHPNLPIYLLGESMGGAVIISTVARSNHPAVKGIILAAPAVWSRQTMPWYQNLLLATLSHTVPWLTLTGESLEITPSDNIEMLRALSRDPIILKETRVESIYGLVNLMDDALANANQIKTNTLLLYGEKDEIIPKQPTLQFLKKINTETQIPHTVGFYKNGYHMLLRDLQAPVLWKDINAWIHQFHSALPSGADQRAKELLSISKNNHSSR